MNQVIVGQRAAFTIAVLDANTPPLPAVIDPHDFVSFTFSPTGFLTTVLDDTPVAGFFASGFLVAASTVQAGIAVTASFQSDVPGGPAPITQSISVDVVADGTAPPVPGAPASLAFVLGPSQPIPPAA